MNKIFLKIFIFSLAIIFINIVNAQKTFLRSDPYESYKVAQELFDKEKYSSAQYYFRDVINKFNNPQNEVRINAEYYFAICGLKLYHRNVETILTRFSLDHPDHPKSKKNASIAPRWKVKFLLKITQSKPERDRNHGMVAKSGR